MKRRHQWLLLASVFFSLGFSKTLRADDFSNNFTANLNQTAIDALAKDMGAIVGAGSFHEAKALGFPLGFDVGVHVPVVGVKNENKILRDDGSSAHAVWGQAEVGLPGKLNVIGRYGKMEDAKMIGGGLRLGIINPIGPGMPALSLTGLYSAVDHDYFEAQVLSANLVFSMDLPIIHPYIGAGYDHTTLDPTDLAFVGAPAGTSTSLDGSANGYRVEAGVNLTIIPFTYLTLGGGITNGEKLYHAGAGVRF